MGGTGTGHQQRLILCVRGLLLLCRFVWTCVMLLDVDLCACAGFFAQSCVLFVMCWYLVGGSEVVGA